MDLPNYIKSDSLKLYKKAFKKKLLKGRSIKGMVAACIYYTCKKYSIPRTFQEFLIEVPINRNLLKNCYKKLVSTFNLKAVISNPIELIPRFITKLGFNYGIEKLTTDILNTYFRKNSFAGKNPNGLCAAAIYMASKLNNAKANQSKIAAIVGVSEVTLRSRYYELIKSISFKLS